MRLASRLVPPPHAAHPPRRTPSCIAIAMRSMQPLLALRDCARNAYNIYSRRREGEVYPHEIDIQETHPKHRKLDSEAVVPHTARDRAAHGLRPKAWPLRASGCDHDPGRLPPWPAGLRGVRPPMAADRTLRGRLHVHRVKNG